MSPWKLTTPVVLFIFNRPDLTSRLFEVIRKVRPPSLLIVADGPRPDRRGEAALCAAARRAVSKVDWPCEVYTNASPVNLGCRERVASGLSWAFGQVGEAILLEDDCLPSVSFFRFCQEMLERYRTDLRVLTVSGYNFESRTDCTSSYFYSKYPHVWGWATWRRVWSHYDVRMSSWPIAKRTGELSHCFATRNEARFWTNTFDAVYDGRIDTWDAQLVYLAFKNRGLTIVPRVSLVENTGFGLRATHTKLPPAFAATAGHELDFPLKHPEAQTALAAWDERRRMAEYLARGPLARGFQILRGVGRSLRQCARSLVF